MSYLIRTFIRRTMNIKHFLFLWELGSALLCDEFFNEPIVLCEYNNLKKKVSLRLKATPRAIELSKGWRLYVDVLNSCSSNSVKQ